MLFASTELIKKVGRNCLLDLDVDWLRYISIEDAYTEYNGMLVRKDDEGDLFLAINQDDCIFEKIPCYL
ncbi:hypothetical protein [Massilimicrobiota timonensis]|uniref:hypothetical protein n=1 Tax=Massilimicrobiota timonensis TaxID=1776392 RepID=UPI00101CAA80|nr:hypothetical protein [Massilimicrobiota timonensis]